MNKIILNKKLYVPLSMGNFWGSWQAKCIMVNDYVIRTKKCF